jgi:hypothetical protein
MSEDNDAYRIDSELQGDEAQDHPQVVNLRTSSVGVVQADLVRLHQSAVQGITSDEVALHQSVALDVTTVEVKAHEAALGMVTTGEAEFTNSGAGVLRAENVNLSGMAGVVVAGSANLGNTYAGLVAGREVRGDRIESLVMLASRVDGEVHTMMDTRGAVIAGMVWGLITGIVILLGHMVFGRRA